MTESSVDTFVHISDAVPLLVMQPVPVDTSSQYLLTHMLSYVDTHLLYYKCTLQTCACQMEPLVHQQTFEKLLSSARKIIAAFVYTSIWPNHTLPIRAVFNQRYGSVVELIVGVMPELPKAFMLQLDVGLNFAPVWRWTHKLDMTSDLLVDINLKKSLWALMFNAYVQSPKHTRESISTWFRSIRGTKPWKVHHPFLREAMLDATLPIVNENAQTVVFTLEQYVAKNKLPTRNSVGKPPKCYDCRKAASELECCDETYYCYACILCNHADHYGQQFILRFA